MQEIIPKISIIVPVYKVEKYLSKCIDSILAQTFKDFELILINDGSPDNSPKICNDYAQKDSRIKVIHQKNAGVSAARNAGLDIAKGEYIGFVDSDDWIEPSTYEIAYNTAIEREADIVQWDFIFDYTSGKKIEKKFGVEGYFNIAEDSSYFYGGMWHKLISKKLIDFESIRFPVGLKYAEDRCFGIDCFLLAKKTYHISKVLYHYCVNEESASFSISRDTILKDVNFVYEKEEKIKSNGGGIGWDYLLYDIKRSAKFRCLFNLDTPDFRLCRSLYKEIDKRLLSRINKYSFFYFFVYVHFDFIAKLLVKIWKTLNENRY
ncbi:MAG: glycosyltransferase [Spirochaetaceae bacterium]|nr:glycosyltransferase [Spirochaetaceae bacterium]